MLGIARRYDVQQTQFPIGDERVESVRMLLAIETNFSMKIPAQSIKEARSKGFA
jgi:hypothetical protein